ncbi:MAG TPA: tautomerase family protein [Aggregatilineales bacterium]|nr:tautomerase family protein [Aggregatilineales bacterium]
MPTVIIYWSPGRTEQQKGDVIRDITETLVTKGSARREDVLIIFQDIKPGDAGRAGRIIGAVHVDGTLDDDSGV